MDHSQVLPDLTEESILKIFERMPLKSIFRARTLCKLWRNSFPDEYMMKRHSEMFPGLLMSVVETHVPTQAKKSFICLDSLGHKLKFSLGFLGEDVQFRASSNGLLCCSKVQQRSQYYILNPMTKDFKLLPNVIGNPTERPRITSLQKKAEVGLIYDLSAQTYRVVVVCYCRHATLHGHENAIVWYVFNSELNNWRVNVSSPTGPFRLAGRVPGVFADGSFHWLEPDRRILSIDLEDNVSSITTLPAHLPPTYGNEFSLLEWNGHLAVIKTSKDLMSAWARRPNDDSIWVVVFRASLRHLQASVPPRPIILTSDYLFLLNTDEMWLYDRRSQQWSKIHARNDWSSVWRSAFAFRSTLCSCR